MPEIDGYVKGVVLDTLWNGFKEVDHLNPKLSQYLIENLRTIKAPTITCDMPKSDETEADFQKESVKSFLKLGKFEIGVRRPDNLLRLGKPIAKCLGSELKAKNNKDKSIPIKFVDPAGNLSSYHVSVNELVREDCHQAIFHEFLHLAGADNKSPEEHNHSDEGSFLQPVTQLDDVVYACSRTAFRYGANSFKDDPEVADFPFPPKMSRSSWVESCMTCSMAQVLNNRVTVIDIFNSSAQEKEKNECEALYTEISEEKLPE